MSYSQCLQGAIDKAVSAAKGSLSPKEVKELIKKVKESLKEDPQNSGEILSDYDKRLEAIAANERLNIKLNAVKNAKNKQYINKYKNPAQGFMNKLVYDKQSVRAQQLSWEQQFLGMFQQDLSKEEMNILQNGTLDVEIAEASANQGTPGKIAKSIGAKINKIRDIIRTKLNNNGAMIGKLENIAPFTQAHNPEKLAQISVNPASTMQKLLSFFQKNKRAMTPEEKTEMAFQQWKDFVKPLVNRAKTKIDQLSESEVDEWLKEFYLNCLSKVHKSLEDNAPAVFSGHNLVARLSQERILHLNSASDEMKYAQKYGYGSLWNNLLQNIQHQAHDLALLENFGSNPEAMFESLKSDYMIQNKANPAIVKELQSRKIQTAWENVIGHRKMAVDRGISTVNANIRAFQAASHFVGSIKTALTMDPIGRAAFLHNNKGEAWLPALFKGYFESLKYLNVDRDQVKNFSHASVVHTLGNMQSRLGMDTMPGQWIGKMQQTLFKWNLLHYLDKARTEGVAMAEAQDLANALRKKEFTDLNKATQNTYNIYGIGPSEYNVLKKAVFKTDKSGHYIFADSVSQMKDEDLKEYAKNNGMTVANARSKLELTISNYLREAAGFMVMDSRDPRMGLIFNYFGGPGTLGGEIARDFLLGKAWPVQYGYRVIAPLLLQGKMSNRIENAAVLTLFSTLMAYGDLSLGNFLNGKTPDDPTDYHTLLKAFERGGGLGWATMAMEFIQNPKSMLPVAWNEIYNLLKIPYDAVAAPQGKGAEVAGKELLNWVASNAPGVTYPFVKLLLDHMIIYKAQEMMDPGSVAKLQYNTQKKGGSYWWAPTSNLPNGIS